MRAHLLFMAASVRASLKEVELCVGSDEELVVPGPTSGKVCLNEAYSSSVGFWELVLFMRAGLATMTEIGHMKMPLTRLQSNTRHLI